MERSVSKFFSGIMSTPIPPPQGKKKSVLYVALCLAILILAGYVTYSVIDNRRPHYARDFHFEDLKSPNDADGDGIDDYSDMVAGALEYIATNPIYESRYYKGGYPNDGYGVCTDVIWRAFAAAGYCLKDMVDADIAENPEEYEKQGTIGDSNIDFRRVRNLQVFFERHAEVLTAASYHPKDWMPGDIVVFDGHIAICSEKRNATGIPYIIHHGNIVQGAVEADDMKKFDVKGHYRFTGGTK